MDGRRHARVAHDAVDAVAHMELGFVGLDVDVGRTLANRFEQQVVDETHDACFACVVAFRRFGLCVGGGRVASAEGLEHIASNAEAVSDLNADVFVFGNDERNRHACGHAQLIERVESQRIAGGNDKSAAFDAHGNRAQFEHEPRRHRAHGFLVDFGFVESDERHREFFGECAHHLLSAGEAEAGERVLKPLTRARLLAGRVVELLVGDKPLRKENRAKRHVCRVATGWCATNESAQAWRESDGGVARPMQRRATQASAVDPADLRRARGFGSARERSRAKRFGCARGSGPRWGRSRPRSEILQSALG